MNKILSFLLNWWTKNRREEQAMITNYLDILKRIEKCRIELKPLEKNHDKLSQNLANCNLSQSHIIDEQLSENKRQQDAIALRFANDILHRAGYSGKYN